MKRLKGPPTAAEESLKLDKLPRLWDRPRAETSEEQDALPVKRAALAGSKTDRWFSP